MSTFPIRDDEYSVEEISYEDMMHALSLQGTSDSQADMLSPNQAAPNQVEKGEHNLPFNKTELDTSSQLNAGENDLAKRLSDNANQALPDWLIKLEKLRDKYRDVRIK